MSRIFIQNLPKKISEADLRKRFAIKGQISDLRLNPDKRHAIIGFVDQQSATEAVDYFNKTYIFTNKITVKLSDEQLITADVVDGQQQLKKIKKHKKDKKHQKKDLISDDKDDDEDNNNSKEKETKRLRKKKILNEELDELKLDPQFKEFLKLQRNVDSAKGKHVWSNDLAIDDEEVDNVDGVVEDNDITDKGVNQEEEDEEEEEEDNNKSNVRPKVEPKQVHEYQLVLRGLPYKIKKRQIKEFCSPAKPLSLRMPPKMKGMAYLSFGSLGDMNQVLVKHRSFLDGHRIEVKNEMRKVMKTTAGEDNNNNNTDNKSAAAAADTASKKQPKWLTAVPADEPVGESGRIFVRNLSYTCDETELRGLFEKYGQIAEFHLPIDSYTKKQKGFAFVTYMFPEHAVRAVAELDKTDFRGRLLHLIASKPKPEDYVPPYAVADNDKTSSFKKQKLKDRKSQSQSSHQWNSLFINQNAVADIMAKKFKVNKSDLLADTNTRDSIAVRMALGETQIINDMRRFLLENGVQLKAFSGTGDGGGDTTDGQQPPPQPRSTTVILVKNLPASTEPQEIRELFAKSGLVHRVILPPYGVTAIVEMQEPSEAKQAFKRLAYTNFKHFPLYLEWAPSNVFKDTNSTAAATSIDDEIKELMVLEGRVKSGEEGEDTNDTNIKTTSTTTTTRQTMNTNDNNSDELLDIEPEEDTTIFVKNLNFDTMDEVFRDHFHRCGQIYSANIQYRKDRDRGQLSMGYGFIQFVYQKSAQKALKTLQNSVLDGHTLELKLSNRTTSKQKDLTGRMSDERQQRRGGGGGQRQAKQTGTKICVKNIPFEATVDDVKKLFRVFGELKAVRLPKKLSQIGSYRGFGFVDFVTKTDAKRAFDALCHSTHLYGRPLVLEWARSTTGDDDDDNVDDDMYGNGGRPRNTSYFHQNGPSNKRLKKSDIVNDLQTKTSIPYNDD
ncbi:probable RNA-binding protein 19 [Oppia nitens]|uniref:probable RNA-binding protein 19 n=1 Tax=Oppia nitens TaxID=1686743 RepID=UPI0023DA87D1|nr:probable RNA-binding protein 19 [Oppia nitens]